MSETLSAQQVDGWRADAATALEEAIEVVGGQSALARVIGTKQQTVWWWRNRTRCAPPEACLKIEEATRSNGQEISRYRLRPDVYGPAP
jgi:DNA-binding transcriptional regulator YdaS (Cro superfamily)